MNRLTARLNFAAEGLYTRLCIVKCSYHKSFNNFCDIIVMNLRFVEKFILSLYVLYKTYTLYIHTLST